MNIWLIVFIIALIAIAFVATIIVIKQEESKMKKYEEEGDTAAEQLKRSHEYETESLKNVKNLSWIYVVFILAMFIGFAVYLINIK